MGQLKKIAWLVLWGAAALLLLLAALHFLIPLAVDTHPVREYLAARIEKATQGQTRFAELKLRLLPRPSVCIGQVRYEKRDQIHLQATSIALYPRILPLLHGRLLIGRVHLDTPKAMLQVPEALPAPQADGAFLAALRDLLQEFPAGTRLTIDHGALSFRRAGRDMGSVDTLSGEFSKNSGSVSAGLDGRSDWADRFHLEAELDAASLQGSASLDLEGIDSASWERALRPEHAQPFARARVDLHLAVRSRGEERFDFQFSASSPAFTLTHGQATVQGRKLQIEGAAELNPQHLHVALSRLSLADPALNLSAALNWGRQARAAVPLHLSVKAHDSDATALRDVLLGLTGPHPLWKVIRGGTLVSLDLESQGESLNSLVDDRNLRISGKASQAHIFVPGVELDLTDASGEWRFSQGVLAVQQGKARLGSTLGQNGSMSLLLRGPASVLQLEIDLTADLAQLPPFLKKVLRQPAAQEELARLRSVRGRAEGHLSLSGALKQMDFKVQASAFAFTAEHDRLPYPAQIKGGGLTLTRGDLTLVHAAVRMSDSAVQGLSGTLRWGQAPRIELASAAAQLAWDQLFPWLARLEGFRERYPQVQRLGGRMDLAQTRLSGPLNSAQELQFSSSGALTGFSVRAGRLPDQLTVAQGRFSLLDGRLALSAARIYLLDSYFEGEGTVDDFRDARTAVAVSGRGMIGDQAALWLHRQLEVPEKWYVRAPIGITQVRLIRHNDTAIKLEGKFYLPGALHLACTFSSGPGGLEIDPLILSDTSSNARLSLRHDTAREIWDIHFSGIVNGAAMAKMWRADPFYAERIEGDLSLRFAAHRPAASRLNGQLAVRNVLSLGTSWGSLSIRRLELEARDALLHVRPLEFTLDGQRGSLDGSVDFSGETIALDLALSAQMLDLTRLMQLRKDLAGQDKPSPAQSARPDWQARIEVAVERLVYGAYSWHALKGYLSLDKERAQMQVNQAQLCGISITGYGRWTPAGLSMEVFPQASGNSLQVAAGCLTGTGPTERIAGTYQIEGRLTAHGPTPDALTANLEGQIYILARDGRVYRAGGVGILSSLLSYLQINNLIRGDLPSLRGGDFLFSRIRLDLDFNAGRVELKTAELISEGLNMVGEGQIDLQTRELDLTVLVSPLTTVDAIIRHLPVVGRILKGTLVAVPVGVRGNLNDPRFRPLSPAAVGNRLLGIMERILQAPFRLIEPLLPQGWDEELQQGRE